MSASSRRGLLCLGAAVPLAALVPAAVIPSPVPDAALLALGAALLAAREVEARAWKVVESAGVEDEEHPLYVAAEAAQEHALTLVHQIEEHAATTLSGLVVKANALAYCRAGDPVTLEVIAPDYRPSCHTTDMRLVVGMLHDLTAMAEAGV